MTTYSCQNIVNNIMHVSIDEKMFTAKKSGHGSSRMVRLKQNSVAWMNNQGMKSSKQRW